MTEPIDEGIDRVLAASGEMCVAMDEILFAVGQAKRGPDAERAGQALTKLLKARAKYDREVMAYEAKEMTTDKPTIVGDLPVVAITLLWEDQGNYSTAQVGNIKVYAHLNGEFRVSSNKTWVTGVYASADAALAAPKADVDGLYELWQARRPAALTLGEVLSVGT